MHLTPERLDRAESWLVRHGPPAIVAGRLTPGLRMATVIACGVFGIPFWRFLPALGLGSLLYTLLYTLLGFLIGPVVLDRHSRAYRAAGIAGAAGDFVCVGRPRAARSAPAAKHRCERGRSTAPLA
jgi:membrane protein DedA with SNARE-associated domain